MVRRDSNCHVVSLPPPEVYTLMHAYTRVHAHTHTHTYTVINLAWEAAVALPSKSCLNCWLSRLGVGWGLWVIERLCYQT